ncbi:MAG: hypothetical protein DBY25_05950 [Clostridiales bacterium]|nr:MAG: hypothetical protein DBY25_05950 [Clostridiales bacterium]
MLRLLFVGSTGGKNFSFYFEEQNRLSPFGFLGAKICVHIPRCVPIPFCCAERQAPVFQQPRFYM